MFDVVCSGNLNLDVIFRTSRMPKQYEKYEAKDVFVELGGSAGNTACWLAKLGAKVGFLGSVGNDFVGDNQIKQLKSFGVNTRGITRSEKLSGVATIFSIKKKKRFVKHIGANRDKKLNKSYLLKAKHVHLSSNPKPYLEKVVDFCKKNKISVSLDPGSMNPSMKLINKLDIFYCNHHEMNRITGCKKLETGMKKLRPGILIVGLNNGDCILKTEDELIEIPALGVKAVDLVGAGDAFVAGFLYGYLNGYPLKKAVMFGIACTAVCIQSVGARTNIPSKQEIETFALRKGYF